MAMRLVVVLGLSAVLVGAGIALRSSPSYSGVAVGMLAIGLCMAACVGALVVARQLKLDRRARSDASAAPRLHALGDDLVQVAEAVERRGMLALAECNVSMYNPMFRRIADLAVGGTDAAALRLQARDIADAQVVVGTHTARRHALAAQCMGVLALGIATAFVGYSLFSGRLLGFSDAAALGLLLLVYATFMLTVIAQELAARSTLVAAEAALAGTLIGESVAHLRSGAGPGVIRAEVERLLTPTATSAPSATSRTRRAA